MIFNREAIASFLENEGIDPDERDHSFLALVDSMEDLMLGYIRRHQPRSSHTILEEPSSRSNDASNEVEPREVAPENESAAVDPLASLPGDHNARLPVLDTTNVSDSGSSVGIGTEEYEYEGDIHEEDPDENIVFYISKVGKVFDTCREAPFGCFNKRCGGAKHFRIHCPFARGVGVFDTVHRSSFTVENDGTRIARGGGFVRGKAAALSYLNISSNQFRVENADS